MNRLSIRLVSFSFSWFFRNYKIPQAMVLLWTKLKVSAVHLSCVMNDFQPGTNALLYFSVLNTLSLCFPYKSNDVNHRNSHKLLDIRVHISAFSSQRSNGCFPLYQSARILNSKRIFSTQKEFLITNPVKQKVCLKLQI